MRRDFEGGIYGNQPPYRCGEISRAARFRGNTVLVIDDKYTIGLYQLLYHTYDVDQSMFCVRTQSKKIITILMFM